MSKRVVSAAGVQIGTNVPTGIEAVVIPLSDLYLRQTLNNPNNRTQLVNDATSKVQQEMRSKSITILSSEGIRFEAQRDAVQVGYKLVAQIWH